MTTRPLTASLSLVCRLTGRDEKEAIFGPEDDFSWGAPGERAWHCSWSPDGTHLASTGADRVIRVWARVDDKWCCVAALEEAQTRTIRSCEWCPMGKHIAAVSFDATTVVWQRQSCDGSENNGEVWEVVAQLEGHENEVKCVAWNSDGTLLATCGRDKSVWIWENLDDDEFDCLSVLHGHTQDVKFVKFHQTEPVLFSCSYDDTIKVWEEDGDDWFCTHTLTGHGSTVWGLSLDREGGRLVSCSADCNIFVWQKFRDEDEDDSSQSADVAASSSWRNVGAVTGLHSRPIYSIDWSAHHGAIATGGEDNAVRVFVEGAADVVAGAENDNGDGGSGDKRPAGTAALAVSAEVVDAHHGDVNCVRWNPAQAELLASVGDDGAVRLWSYRP